MRSFKRVPYRRAVTTLGLLSEADARLFVARTVDSFIDDLVESGVDRNLAVAASADYIGQLLPDGVGTEGHRFRSIDDVGHSVGRLWFGRLRGSPGDWYVFEIDIDEGARGQGAGRRALQMVISELRILGADRLGLNVFDSNVTALALYESLGFQVVRHSDGQREMLLQLNVSR